MPEGYWRGRRVLELGSGTGHLAVGLARLGAHVVATESAESHNGAISSSFLTMQAWTTHLLGLRPGGGGEPTADGSYSSGSEGGTVTFRKLHWGLDDLEPNAFDGFDVMILSELYFDPDLHEALLESLGRLLKPGMTAYSIFVDRPFSCGFLLMLDDDGTFDVKEIDVKEAFGMSDDEIIYMHEITRKA